MPLDEKSRDAIEKITTSLLIEVVITPPINKNSFDALVDRTVLRICGVLEEEEVNAT